MTCMQCLQLVLIILRAPTMKVQQSVDLLAGARIKQNSPFTSREGHLPRVGSEELRCKPPSLRLFPEIVMNSTVSVSLVAVLVKNENTQMSKQ